MRGGDATSTTAPDATSVAATNLATPAAPGTPTVRRPVSNPPVIGTPIVASLSPTPSRQAPATATATTLVPRAAAVTVTPIPPQLASTPRPPTQAQAPVPTPTAAAVDDEPTPVVPNVVIAAVDPLEEIITIQNRGLTAVAMGDWFLQIGPDDDAYIYVFLARFRLAVGASVRVHPFDGRDGARDLYFNEGRDRTYPEDHVLDDRGGVVVLFNLDGEEVSRRQYP